MRECKYHWFNGGSGQVFRIKSIGVPAHVTVFVMRVFLDHGCQIESRREVH